MPVWEVTKDGKTVKVTADSAEEAAKQLGGSQFDKDVSVRYSYADSGCPGGVCQPDKEEPPDETPKFTPPTEYKPPVKDDSEDKGTTTSKTEIVPKDEAVMSRTDAAREWAQIYGQIPSEKDDPAARKLYEEQVAAIQRGEDVGSTVTVKVYTVQTQRGEKKFEVLSDPSNPQNEIDQAYDIITAGKKIFPPLVECEFCRVFEEIGHKPGKEA